MPDPAVTQATIALRNVSDQYPGMAPKIGAPGQVLTTNPDGSAAAWVDPAQLYTSLNNQIILIQPPPVMTAANGLVIWYDATILAGQGAIDGAALASFTDRMGNTFTKVGASGAVYRANRFGGAPSLEFTGQGYRCTDAAVLAMLNGAGTKEYSIYDLSQQTWMSDTESYLWGFGDQTVGAFAVGQYMRVIKNDFRYNFLDLAVGVNVNSTLLNTSCPVLSEVYRPGGSAIVMGDDGRVEPAFADVHATQTINSFVIGCYDGTSPVFKSQYRKAGLIAFNRNLSYAERDSVRNYCRLALPGLRNKSGLGATVPAGSTKTRVFVFIGQSNIEARGGARPYRQIASPTRSLLLGLDGFSKPLTEPLSDSTNQVCGGQVHDPAAPGIGNIGASPAPDLANGITAAYPADVVCVVPCAKGSTGSFDWNNSTTTAPPVIDSLIGFTKLRILEAMKLPGAVLSEIVIHLGTTNALPPGPAQPATAAQYQTDMQAVKNEFVTWAAAQGVPWEKQNRFIQFLISVINTATLPYCTNVVTAQHALQSANPTDMTTIQAQDPVIDPIHLHEDTSELAVDGQHIASTHLAAN